MIGKTLAHYEIEGRLGEGGSGVVYRGRDLRLERQVAIKVLADALRDDELAWARLLREARLASQLNHPHIAAIYDLGEEEGRAYIVMEYVEGLPLADLIPEGGMPPEQVAALRRADCRRAGFRPRARHHSWRLEGIQHHRYSRRKYQAAGFRPGPPHSTQRHGGSHNFMPDLGGSRRDGGNSALSRTGSAARQSHQSRKATYGRWVCCSTRWLSASCRSAAPLPSSSAWKSWWASRKSWRNSRNRSSPQCAIAWKKILSTAFPKGAIWYVRLREMLAWLSPAWNLCLWS